MLTVIKLKAVLPEGFLLCEDGVKRNRRHVRALTDEEVAQHQKSEKAVASTGEDWAPCDNVEALEPHVSARLVKSIQAGVYKHTNPYLYQLFIERVAKVYNHEVCKLAEETDDSDAGMHAERAELVHLACERVLEQIPRRQRPHNNNARRAAKHVLPVLEELFEMPARGPPVGSNEWLKQMQSDPGSISYKEMDKYDALMRCHTKHSLKTLFNARGHLRLLEGEVVPTGKYLASKAPPTRCMIKSTRRAMKKHKDFKLMRSGGVFYAFERMREKGTYPRKMHPETLPKLPGKTRLTKWDNFNKCKVRFHARYCAAQGRQPHSPTIY